MIDGYKEDEEILFLVDLFGGSPYNAAFETVIGQDRMDVITGLSLPMLIDVVGIRTMEEDIKAGEVYDKLSGDYVKSCRNRLVQRSKRTANHYLQWWSSKRPDP